MADSRNAVVLGLQWGDEGKGKVIDVLAAQVDYVVRCQGGANAGHTVVVDGQKTVLHLLPSGALHPNAACVIGNGVVVDPLAICAELDHLGPAGQELERRLTVSDRAHLVLPCHKALDRAIEAAKGERKAGTTLRGIGPCYTDKVMRIGLRCGELSDLDRFVTALREHAALIAPQLLAWGAEPLDIDTMLDEVMPACRRLAPLVGDSVAMLQRAQEAGKCMLFEGAQGTMLDIDYGTYPYVTSSNTGLGGIITGSGLSHKAMGKVVGIAKAYTTRVGEGPCPTELSNAKGEALRERGGEFGATTGRPRRCGWLDLVVVGYACRLNGVDSIALTKLDVLSGEDEILVCTGYELDGRVIDTVPGQNDAYQRCQPVYQRLPGWSCDLASCSRFEDLPQAARDYVAFIERQTGVAVGWIGTGPGREATICR